MTEPQQHDGVERRYPHVFRPIRVGTLSLDHRLVVPPHGGGNGSLMGTDDDFEQHAALWLAKLAGGMRWLGGGPNFVRNPLPPGFEPTGVGAHGPGFFRDPRYPARIGELATRVHAGGGLLSVQMVLQGGMPIAPSNTLSSYADHRIPHALDLDEVHWLIGSTANRPPSPSTRASTPSRSTPTTTTWCSGSSRREPTAATTSTAAPPSSGGGSCARSSRRSATTPRVPSPSACGSALTR